MSLKLLTEMDLRNADTTFRVLVCFGFEPPNANQISEIETQLQL